MNEDDVVKLLAGWLTSHGSEVYANKKGLGYPVFRCNSSRKLDMLVLFDSEYFGLEVKKNTGPLDQYNNILHTESNIYAGFNQLLKYAKNNAIYYVNNDPVVISGYALATGNSVRGGIFLDENILHNRNTGFMDYSNFGGVHLHNLPFTGVLKTHINMSGRLFPVSEYSKSTTCCQMFWRWSKAVLCDKEVGLLLSTGLNTSCDYGKFYPIIWTKTLHQPPTLRILSSRKIRYHT